MVSTYTPHLALLTVTIFITSLVIFKFNAGKQASPKYSRKKGGGGNSHPVSPFFKCCVESEINSVVPHKKNKYLMQKKLIKVNTSTELI